MGSDRLTKLMNTLSDVRSCIDIYSFHLNYYRGSGVGYYYPNVNMASRWRIEDNKEQLGELKKFTRKVESIIGQSIPKMQSHLINMNNKLADLKKYYIKKDITNFSQANIEIIDILVHAYEYLEKVLMDGKVVNGIVEPKKVKRFPFIYQP